MSADKYEVDSSIFPLGFGVNTLYSVRIMRLTFTVLITASVIALHILDNPDRARQLWREVSTRGQNGLEVQEVRVEGLSILSRTEIEKALPSGRSVVWWKLNDTGIQGMLKKNPWVADAKVSPCPGSVSSAWGCFVISIKERVPAYVANVDETLWLIDRDASFIAPMADAASRGYSTSLVSVSGLASRNSSPDLVRAQLASVTRLVDDLHESVGRNVQSLEFINSGDFGVGLEGLPFPVIFAGGRDSKISVREQGARCAELLRHLQSRFSEIERIDLAFDRVGVVKFRPAPPQP